MSKILTILAVVCLLGFWFVGSSKGETFIAKGELTVGLIGMQVKNSSGEILGSISDLIFDPKGRPAVAILYQGDVEKNIEKVDVTRHVAIPFTTLSISRMEPSQLSVVLNIDKVKLYAAPKFDKTKDLNDMEWAARVYRYFVQQPYWKKWLFQWED